MGFYLENTFIEPKDNLNYKKNYESSLNLAFG